MPLLMSTNASYLESKKSVQSPLLIVHFKNGSSKMYFCVNHFDEYNQNWGTDREIYTTSNTIKDLPQKSLSVLDIISELQNSGSSVFECYLTANTEIENLLEAIISVNQASWEKIYKAIPEGEDVQLTYSDRYLKTPLGCILLAQLISQLKVKLQFKPSKLTIMLPTGIISSGSMYSSYDESTHDIKLTDDFPSYKECDKFLRMCLMKICDINCEIIHERLPHYRSLTISGKSFELSIRPDGGVAYGWALDNRTNPDLTLTNVKEELDQNINLFNRASMSGGILYTFAYKRKK
jgi:hypothetical protein